MHRIANCASPHTVADIEFEAGYPPLAPTDGNRGLLALVDQASQDLGLGALTTGRSRACRRGRCVVPRRHVPRIIDAMGLKGTGGHTVQETGRLRSLPWQAKRVAVLL